METRVAGKGFTGFCTEFIIFGRNAAGNNGMGWKKNGNHSGTPRKRPQRHAQGKSSLGFGRQRRHKSGDAQPNVNGILRHLFQCTEFLFLFVVLCIFTSFVAEKSSAADLRLLHFAIFPFLGSILFLSFYQRGSFLVRTFFFWGGGILIGFSIGKPSDAPWLLVPTDLYHCPPFST